MAQKQYGLTQEAYHRHTDDMNGLCIKCHAVTFGDVEQDVEERTCSSCGEDAVMGFEQALVHDLLLLDSDS